MQGEGKDFSKINLERSYLAAADLQNADLSQANLMGVNLERANLTNTNLAGTDLKGANLLDAVFTNANLSGADLRGTRLLQAINLTCQQIKSAVIDKNTQLPSYIIITGNPEASYQCKALSKKSIN